MYKLVGEKWSDLKKIAIFGYGRQGSRIYKTLKNDFEVVAIIDNNKEKQGEDIGEHKIDSIENYLVKHQHPIIVTVQESNYVKIKDQLEQFGLREGIDFIDSQSFVGEWYIRFGEKAVVMKMDVPITHFCTLRCKNCIDSVPYIKNKEEKNIEDIKRSLEKFFSLIDYVMDFTLIGGEPFLYREMGSLLDYIHLNYSTQIGCLNIITNGTLIPSDDVMKRIKEYGVCVSISDYSDVVDYKHKVDKLCNVLKEYNVEFYRNSQIEWFDFGIVTKKWFFEDAYAHMKLCNTTCHILDNERIYYCSVDYSAQIGGLSQNDSNSYIDLNDMKVNAEGKKKIIDFLSGQLDGALLLCQRCGGFGIDNKERVIAGEQI